MKLRTILTVCSLITILGSCAVFVYDDDGDDDRKRRNNNDDTITIIYSSGTHNPVLP